MLGLGFGTLRRPQLEIRTKLNQSASAGGERAQGDEEPSTSGPGSEAKRARDAAPVSLEEERKLLRFYESKVAGICVEMRLPKKVQATAVQYFKRFFLRNSCLMNDPLKTLLTCIYLAAKIEESYIGAEEFCRALKQDANTVLRAEVGVLQGLHFDLVTHSPYRALAGLLQDLEDARSSQGASTSGIESEVLTAAADVITHCRLKAISAVDALMLTDAPLLHTPAQLAMAALRSGLRSKGLKLGAGYYEHTVSTALGQGAKPGAVKEAVAALTEALDDIDKLGMEGAQKVEQQDVVEIDKKIKLWKTSQNPLLDPNSDAAKAAAAAAERDKADKREAKVRARAQAAAAEQKTLLGMPPPAPV